MCLPVAAILFAGLTELARHMVEWFKKPDRRIAKFSRNLLLVIGSAIAALIFASSAWAQYSFNPDNADEKGPGIKYFGSAKDDQGALLPGVTMVIAHAYTMVTDDQGRYRGNI